MSSKSRSKSGSSPDKDRNRSRSPSQERKNGKLFVTNIDGQADLQQIESELRKLFEKYGPVESLVAKRNRNSEYCFAFVEMKTYNSAQDCVKNYDQATVLGKKVKVEFQDDGKRRKDSNKGCYNCGKIGHFARECRSQRNDDRRRDRGYGRRDRSPSSSGDNRRKEKKSKRKHRRSESSERERSYSRDKKHRRHREKSREREEKKKKSHKRSRQSSYSR